MGKSIEKKNRLLDIFYRAMRGEYIYVREVAEQYGVSTKSISRDINEIKNFLSDQRDLTGNAEMKYSSTEKAYYLELDNFLLSKELFAIMKMMIGCRAYSKEELKQLIDKLETFTTHREKIILKHLVQKELLHYQQVGHDCDSVVDLLWVLARCIEEKKEITITYFRMDRKKIERKIMPLAVMFSEYYYYLIAASSESDEWKPLYYRVDRITHIVEHRTRFETRKNENFDEGDLRNKIHYMFPGEYRKIQFEFSGPSIQAILDKIPTAKVIEDRGQVKIVEAWIYGSGINMFLLSQGSWVKVLEPQELVEEIKNEIEKMLKGYQIE